jgi:hypothetical protein
VYIIRKCIINVRFNLQTGLDTKNMQGLETPLALSVIRIHIYHSIGTWVHKVSCIMEPKEYQKDGPDIVVHNTGVEYSINKDYLILP